MASPASTPPPSRVQTPLLFDPGTQWEYGSNIDSAGQVVQAVAGKRLGQVMAERSLRAAWHDRLRPLLNASMRELYGRRCTSVKTDGSPHADRL